MWPPFYPPQCLSSCDPQLPPQETLRYHPVVYGPFVETMQDEVIPLSQPIETATGEVISEIPVGKGQMIHLSLCGYNRYARALFGSVSVVDANLLAH